MARPNFHQLWDAVLILFNKILAKEKDLQKEKYESQIAELDSTIRGLESKKSGLTNEFEQSKKTMTN